MTSSLKVARDVGVSYRRLDYWARCGYLRPGNDGRGSGSWRVWSDEELTVARCIVRLQNFGLTLEAAAAVARAAVESGDATYYANDGGGVWLAIVVEPSATRTDPGPTSRGRSRRP